MEKLKRLMEKDSRLVIGLMSGTSTDGIDAVLVRIEGCGIATKLQTLGFISLPYERAFADHLLGTAKGDAGGTADLCLLNFALGHRFADAALELCRVCGVSTSEIDLVGSHGHTVYHAPVAADYYGMPVAGTLQIGEASVISEALGCVTVSDFRVRDMAAGGLGAPLVPYTEYILYADPQRDVALQNIGGIGNVTLLPRGCTLEQVRAFDTGPGNMVMDAVCRLLTGGKQDYDMGGALAAKGRIHEALLDWLEEDDYLRLPPPKTTGREMYGQAYVERLMAKAESLDVSQLDTLATVTMFTARCIQLSLERFCPTQPQRLIVGGGGAFNPTLLSMLAQCLPNCEVVTNEAIGLDSAAKEAVAFALLANETVSEQCNNAPTATGARHSVVMGKISL